MAVVKLYLHQEKAVAMLNNGKILRGDPGVGKSITALSYFYIRECGGVLNDWGSLKTPKDLYIITTAKKRNDGDWQKDAYIMGLMENRSISVAGIKVTVDSWNQIENYVDVENAFFIFDEAKGGGSGVWGKTFIKIAKKNNWILLTATPGDVWMDYLSVFLANGFYKNRSEFKDKHVVYASWSKFPKIERYTGLNELVRNRNAVLVEMRYQRHTTRHLETILVQHNTDDMEKVSKNRWHIYEERPIKDVSELFAVARKVSNTDPSRLASIQALQKKHKRLIVFYNFDYELEILRTLGQPPISTTSVSISNPLLKTNSDSSTTSSKEEALVRLAQLRDSKARTQFVPSGFVDTPSLPSSTMSGPTSPKISTTKSPIIGETSGPSKIKSERLSQAKMSSLSIESSSGVTVAEWNGHKHQPVPTTDEWIYLVQYRAGAEAWNCVATDAMAFYSMTYSYKDFEQSQGRIDRLNTKYTHLWYYLLISEAWIDTAIKKSLDSKQDFNEKRHRVYSDADLEPSRG